VGFTKDYEVIVVNDGSTDDALAVLQKLQKKIPTLTIISHDTTQGYGATLIDGFHKASKEWVFYTDGDGQYDVTEMPKLVEKITDGINVVNGYKLNRNDPLFRLIIGELYNFFLHIFFPLQIDDIDCDFRFIKRSLLKKLTLTTTSGAICLELVLQLQKAGASFAQAGVHHYKRPYGKSKFFNLPNILKTMKENIALYLNLHKRP
jgi:glycosyltransferase involved in cell wall biosynthesis